VIVCLNIADDAGEFLLGDGEGVAVEHTVLVIDDQAHQHQA
jgi:hypothetical protein